MIARVNVRPLVRIQGALGSLGALLDEKGGKSLDYPDEMCKAFVNVKGILESFFADELEGCLLRVNLVINNISDGRVTRADIGWMIRGLRQELQSAIGRLLLIRIPSNRKNYLDGGVFAPIIRDSFPSAGLHLTEAQYCFAFGDGTACVFHLARSLEGPLRALARRTRVEIPPRAARGAMLTLIDERLGTTTPSDNDSQFFSDVSRGLRRFKDEWLDPPSHEQTYSLDEAEQVMIVLKPFIELLARHLREE